MSNDFKKLLKVCAAIGVLIAAVRIAHEISLRLLKRVDRCDMPCQWDYEKGFDNCQPLKLTLEVKVTPQPRGGRHMVWYRATTMNQSCSVIDLEDSFYKNGFVHDSRVDTDHFSFLSVKDAAGNTAPDGLIGPTQGINSFEKEIHPYRINTSDLHAHIRRFMSEKQEFTELRLLPGESASTSYDELAPYREEMFDVETKQYIGTGVAPVPVKMDHPEQIYAVPPPGFRRLFEYDLKPGKYTAQFIVRENSTVTPFRDPTSSRLRRLTRMIVHFFAAKPEDAEITHIDAVSPRVDIAVPE